MTAALARLPGRDAELLRLWAWDELSTHEIAIVLGIGDGAAAVRLHRAKEELRREVERERSGPEPDTRAVRGGGERRPSTTARADAAVTRTTRCGPCCAAPTPRTTCPPGAESASASCAVMTAEDLSQRETAFEARATGIDGGVVTLEVVDRYKGEVEDDVTVTQPSDEGIGYSPAPFIEGQDHLIGADEGRLSWCGRTGVASPERRALYDRAFPG